VFSKGYKEKSMNDRENKEVRNKNMGKLYFITAEVRLVDKKAETIYHHYEFDITKETNKIYHLFRDDNGILDKRTLKKVQLNQISFKPFDNAKILECSCWCEVDSRESIIKKMLVLMLGYSTSSKEKFAKLSKQLCKDFETVRERELYDD